MTRTAKYFGFGKTKKIIIAFVTLLATIILSVPISSTHAYAESFDGTVDDFNECITTAEVISVEKTSDGRSVLRVKQCYYYDYIRKPDNCFFIISEVYGSNGDTLYGNIVDSGYVSASYPAYRLCEKTDFRISGNKQSVDVEFHAQHYRAYNQLSSDAVYDFNVSFSASKGDIYGEM